MLSCGSSRVALAIGWLLVAPASLGAEEGQLAPRYPLEAFFADKELSGALISPSGRHVAGLQLVDGQPNIVRIDLATREVTPVTRGRKRINDFWWVNDERILYSTISKRGRSRQLHGIDTDGSSRKRLTFSDFLISLLPGDPKHVLIAEPYAPSPRRIASRVLRLNVYSGSTRVWTSSRRGAKHWIADSDGVVRIGYGEIRSEGFFIYREDRGEPWVAVGLDDRFPLDEMNFVPLGFSDDPNEIFVSARVHSDRFAIHKFDVTKRTFSPPLFADPVFDVSGPLRFSVGSNGERQLAGVEYRGDFYRTHWMDEGWRKLMDDVDRAMPGRVNRLLGTSRDGSVILILSVSDRHPGTYYAHYPSRGKMYPIAKHRPQLDAEQMVEVRPVTYTARDGLQIPAYLALPKGREGERVPLIVNPHGGPWARDDREFDPVLQFFANRGWAVFRPNFRGSAGYGLEFQKKGYRQWGDAMQNDITDGVRWLVEQGIVDPDRICIYGTSYGGYAALIGLIETPELYRCGASFAGATDLERLVSKREWHDDPRLWDRLIGEDDDALRESSPLKRASRISAPVFLAHGLDDRVVPPRQTKRMAKALRRARKPHEVLLLKHEGHGLFYEKNRLQYYERLEAFLSKHLDAGTPASAQATP